MCISSNLTQQMQLQYSCGETDVYLMLKYIEETQVKTNSKSQKFSYNLKIVPSVITLLD